MVVFLQSHFVRGLTTYVSYTHFYLGNDSDGDASITQFHGEAKAGADAVARWMEARATPSHVYRLLLDHSHSVPRNSILLIATHAHTRRFATELFICAMQTLLDTMTCTTYRQNITHVLKCLCLTSSIWVLGLLSIILVATLNMLSFVKCFSDRWLLLIEQ